MSENYEIFLWKKPGIFSTPLTIKEIEKTQWKIHNTLNPGVYWEPVGFFSCPIMEERMNENT